ncbi:MAG: hypothetical protein Q7R47_07120, partial [Candidatus Diapherotrites archaeon]|nr:hypothetical protein [Candidatus Diapherotrites archaeon]
MDFDFRLSIIPLGHTSTGCLSLPKTRTILFLWTAAILPFLKPSESNPWEIAHDFSSRAIDNFFSIRISFNSKTERESKTEKPLVFSDSSMARSA